MKSKTADLVTVIGAGMIVALQYLLIFGAVEVMEAVKVNGMRILIALLILTR